MSVFSCENFLSSDVAAIPCQSQCQLWSDVRLVGCNHQQWYPCSWHVTKQCAVQHSYYQVTKKCNFATPLIKKLYIKKWGHKNLLLHRYKKHYDKVTKTYYSTDTKHTEKVTKTYYSTDTKTLQEGHKNILLHRYKTLWESHKNIPSPLNKWKKYHEKVAET